VNGFSVKESPDCVMALTAVLIALSCWRTRSGYLRHSFATNTALMSVGFILVGYQAAGYFSRCNELKERYGHETDAAAGPRRRRGSRWRWVTAAAASGHQQRSGLARPSFSGNTARGRGL
jgi:hypothetical protein